MSLDDHATPEDAAVAWPGDSSTAAAPPPRAADPDCDHVRDHGRDRERDHDRDQDRDHDCAGGTAVAADTGDGDRDRASRRLQVLVVSHLLGRERGAGVARRAITVARALAQLGARVQLLGTDTGLGAIDRADLADLDVTIARGGFSRFPLPLLSLSRLSRQVAQSQVVLLFNHWTALNVLVYALARRHGVPHIVCPCGALLIAGRSTRLKRAYNRIAGRALVRDAAGWVATTPLERTEFEPYGIAADRVTVIPNAVAVDGESAALSLEAIDEAPGRDTAQAHVPREEVNEPRGAARADEAAAFRQAHGLHDAPFLLFMGRLNPIKGPDLLLDAFAAIAADWPSLHLLFAGHDEGLGAELRARADAHGLAARVRFAGFLRGAEQRAAYREALLLVVPSRREAMSLVALEAGAAGTPVLLTDACGFDAAPHGGGHDHGDRDGDGDRLSDGAGVCVVSPTADALADGLRRLLANPDDLPRRGARLRRHVETTYGWDRIGLRWLSLLTRVAAIAPSSASASSRGAL